MTSTPKYAHMVTKKPDGFYIQFERVIEDDDVNDRPDERDEGFWPTDDPDSAGYVLPERYAEEMSKAETRMAAWEHGDWNYVGVRARAMCMIVRNGRGTFINLDSAGTWGVESDAGDYLGELYAEQIEELKDMIAAMTNPIYADARGVFP